MDTVVSAVKGAVRAGINRRFHSFTGIAGRTYFIEIPDLFQMGYHPENCRVSGLDGRDYCKNTAKAVVHRGQRLRGPIKVTLEKIIAPGDPLRFSDDVYFTKDECPRFVTEPCKVTYLGPALLY
jgi:hypothetical protein